MAKTLPHFLSVFEKRLDRVKNDIKKEIAKPKKDRSKSKLKSFLGEAHAMKKAIKEVKEDHIVKCPHCGKEI